MRTFRDAKVMAKALRLGLKERSIALSHSDCLELVARQFGFRDWNTLAAQIAPEPNEALRLPRGWLRSGSKPEHFDMGIDPAEPASQAVIRCRFAADDPAYVNVEKGFGTLMQSVLADAFRGRVLRLAADLRSQEVGGAGTIWMRIERGPGQILRFDNMEDRPLNGALHGTVDWSRREIVLDIPDDAASIHYGFYLRGTGTLWARNFAIEELGQDAIGAARSQPSYLDGPTNLGFAPT